VRHRAVHAAIVALAVLALGAPAAAQSGPSASAAAYGVRVVLPDGKLGLAGSVSAPPRASASLAGWSYAADTVVTGGISTGARTDGGAASSTSSGGAFVRSLSLFGGEVTLESASARATARADGAGASGSLSGSTLSGLVILGKAVRPSENARFPLGDWGYAVALEKAVVSQSGARHGYRTFVTALHVVLTAEHGGLPAGTEITVGYSEAAASAPKPKPAPAPEPTQPPKPSPPPTNAPQPLPEPEQEGPPREPASPSVPQVPSAVQAPPPNVKPKLTTAGYVFPVYGRATPSDSFGAPRTTTWHHGVDIFAPLGAPILAVADGTLFNVGWNDVGGNRFWLRDGAGNEFYYAHLSAFSPLARDGRQVKAGDVIGFVGTTGDAVGTPPHLHFEIHPRELLWMGYDGAIDPYPYLLAWLRLDDLDFGTWTPGPGRAPEVGAVLLQADDISTLSGLGDDTLTSYLVVPALFGEGDPGPVIVGAEPGFGG
jgi:murein DD-endopeptidase MepM/ murein hydrolase activator NlpD